IEQKQRRHAAALGDQLRLGEQQREHCEPLLALRAEAAELAAAGGEHHVVEMRAGSGHTTFQIAVGAGVESRDGRRLTVISQLRIREAELAGSLGERRAEKRKRLSARVDERGTKLRDLLGPRLKGSARREPR